MNGLQVIIDNRMLSNRYPLSLFSDLEWRVLHYHYRANNWITGMTVWGHKAFRQYAPCTLSCYKNALQNLIYRGLMSVEYKSRTQHVKTMYIAPVGWVDEAPIYPTGMRIEFTGFNIKKSHTHFTRIPRPIYMKGLAELDSDTRRLHLTLHHYDNEMLGGVDPNAVCVIDGNIRVSRRLAFNVGVGTSHIKTMLGVLEQKGYISYRETVISEERMDMDKRLVSAGDAGPDRQLVLNSPDIVQTTRGNPPGHDAAGVAAEIMAGSPGEGDDSP